MLKIIAGSLGGRRLQIPPGKGTRPSGARLREALFAILQAKGMLEATEVLDVCAGCGALGLEAISRGALSCVFIERDRQALPALKANLQLAGERAVLVADDFQRFNQGAFNLVLADPPYNQGLALAILPWLAETGLVMPAGWVVIEHALRETPLGGSMFRQVDQRRYGQSKISFFERN